MNRSELFEKLFVEEVAKDIFEMVISLDFTRHPGVVKTYRYKIVDKEVLVIREYEKGERILERFCVDVDSLVLYCAKKVIREKLAKKLYVNLLEALARLRVALRLSNSMIYSRAESLKDVKGDELKECFWYSEALLYNIINAFENLEVLEGIIIFRIFLEEFINMILLFLNIDKEGKFGERIDKLEKAAIINHKDARFLRHTYHKISEILHASHSTLRGRESYYDHRVIGRIGLDFDYSLAVEQSKFLTKSLIHCIIVLLQLLITMRKTVMREETK